MLSFSITCSSELLSAWSMGTSSALIQQDNIDALDMSAKHINKGGYEIQISIRPITIPSTRPYTCHSFCKPHFSAAQSPRQSPAIPPHNRYPIPISYPATHRQISLSSRFPICPPNTHSSFSIPPSPSELRHHASAPAIVSIDSSKV